MKPTMEKMTKPANMLVQELMQQTMIESLKNKRAGEAIGDNYRRVGPEGSSLRGKGKGF